MLRYRVSEYTPGEWEVTATDAPSTGGYCHIDLRHNSAALDFSFLPAKDRPEAFGPFIRVTNSYNGKRALSFSVGFYRKVCTNGLIVPRAIIHFSFSHLKSEIGETIKFHIAHDKLAEARASLDGELKVLRNCELPRLHFEPLVLKALLIKPPEPQESKKRKLSEWKDLRTHLWEINNRYAEDLGENAYAVFNTITEFASRPPINDFVNRDRHSLQKLAGAWLSEFGKRIQRDDFSIETYLSEPFVTTSASRSFSSIN